MLMRSDPSRARRHLAGLLAVAGVVLASMVLVGTPSSADAICQDGTYSTADGQGACSWHGGVDHWLDGSGAPGNSSAAGGQILVADGAANDSASSGSSEQPWLAENWPWLVGAGGVGWLLGSRAVRR